MIPSREQLDGLSYERAELFGKPHIGARYEKVCDEKGLHDEHSLDDGACCAICGRPATDAHHIAQKGMGGGSRVFPLFTDYGVFPMRSALFALCRECHNAFHRGDLKVRWEWNAEEAAQLWWDGNLLSHGYNTHDERLFNYGWYVVSGDREAVIRG